MKTIKPNMARPRLRFRVARRACAHSGSPGRRRCWFPLLPFLVASFLGGLVTAFAQDNYLHTDYENYWFTTAPTGPFTNYFGPTFSNACTACFGGNVLGDTNKTRPRGGGFGLEWSSFGQPVQGIQSDVSLGDVITPPVGTDTNRAPANFVAVTCGDNTNAYYQCTNPAGGAFWVPSTHQIIAAQPNNITIDWYMTNGTVNRQVLNVNAIPVKRPARIFWTEEPYDAPAVDMSGLFPVIHYNTLVPSPVYQVSTNYDGTNAYYTTNIVSGVWLDSATKQLRAKNVSGLFLVEYYEEGNYDTQVQPSGIEVVQVLEPDLQLVKANVGARLMPTDTYWANLDGINGLIPNVTHGLEDPATAFVYDRTGPKDHWVFPIRRTWSEPWTLEIYWQHKGSMGVLWPYEVDWYSCNWPPYPQRYIVGDDPPNDSAAVLIPSELVVEVMEDMDPALHASLSSGGHAFFTTEPGTCLLKYTTSDNIWFEVVQTVSHTNDACFDLEPVDWPIGKEMAPGEPSAHALRFDGANDYVQVGTSYLNARSDWTLSLWFNAAKITSGVLYSEGDPWATMSVEFNSSGQLQVWTCNESNSWSTATTVNAPLRTNYWHYLAITYSGGSATNGTVAIHLDDYTYTTNHVHWVNCGGTLESAMGAKMASSVNGPMTFYQGKLNMLRLYNTVLTDGQIQTNRYAAGPEVRGNLIASFPFTEGQGNVVQNQAGSYDGTIYGDAVWGYGQYIPIEGWSAYPGYIHLAEGDRYNVNRYAYPTESQPDSESYIFGVNSGSLEVWWANRSRFLDMPAVYYPSRVVRYTNTWPTDAPQIVIASGAGSSSNWVSSDNALSFTGSSGNYVTVPNAALLGVTNELTVEAWVNLSMAASSNNEKIVSCMSPSGKNGYLLGVYQKSVDVELYTGTGRQQTLYYTGHVPSNSWTHIAFTYKAGGTIVTYVNGQMVGSVSVPNESITSPTGDLIIGRASWTDGYWTQGAIGEVRIWNVARSGADILGSYATRLSGTESALVAYYPFVQADDPKILTDAGLLGRHGTITGAAWTKPGRLVSTPVQLVYGSPSIYCQNDPSLAGYNPNEEHALMMGGVFYALRNDLNTADSSEPFVLVDYLDPQTARPKMAAFSVAATNQYYTFERYLNAGLAIQPIMPLAAMPLCTNTVSDPFPPVPPAFRDRKFGWWAISAGNDGGITNATMLFYYQMQPTFYFPELTAGEQPAVGAELPWLPTTHEDGGRAGYPVPFVYRISWPDDVPELKLGQTLTLAYHGLPEIWGQLSVDVEYDQSAITNGRQSVVLFDPIQAQGVPLDHAVIDSLIQIKQARQDATSSLIRFPNLPPSLYPRLYYDPNAGSGGQLVLQGERVETLTGSGYLLLNVMADFEKMSARDMAAALDSTSRGLWDSAVNNLPGPDRLTLIERNTPYVKAALGARLTNGVGYVTLIFNNSTNKDQVPSAQPISPSVIKVVPELYSGDLEVLSPDDALAEELSLRYSADLAGQVEEAEFEWRWIEPSGGLIPNANFGSWYVYGVDDAIGTNEISLLGASLFTMSDHYFAVRYRPTNPNGPSGTNWSDWTYNLAPGWVKRAMTGVNPFEQIFQDQVSYGVDTRVTMISQAGGPYEGDVALNLNAASSAGLIATYQTIFNRAKAFSLDANMSDENMNQTLLFAASRLHDLYMLLGNEAFADAQDPTIAFPTSLSVDQHGADATSVFCFMNQVPNLLEEELALLRGRDDTLEPSTHTSPIYNRLIWNYTQGINGGEAAYAYSYNIRGDPSNTVGVITADDAKRFYPQGHGDAWGHYLSAISPYYDLLSYTIFGWQTKAESTLVGSSATVSVDYFDEQKFVETAAARARTGAEIVKQTFRQRYSEDPTGRWPGYADSNTNRAWGIGDWASRAGQAAYYDWAVANSLMLDHLTNMVQVGGANLPPEGIQKIDRASTPELCEMAAQYRDIQAVVDSANTGLNPLGLARNAVPFDIDPTAIDAGQTHFEQIYDRALQALYNACVAFDHARNVTLQLREQSDSTYDLAESLAASETDYHNRLIEIYGYPYPDDIGAGKTYPEGYDGPDLTNWRILDLENLLANAPTGQVMTASVRTLNFAVSNDWSGKSYEDYLDLPNEVISSTNELGTISVCMADNGLQVKPSGWTTQRPAQGELQLALSDYVQTWYSLQAKMAEYDQTMADLEIEIAHRQSEYVRYPNEWKSTVENNESEKDTKGNVATSKMLKQAMELAATATKEIGAIGAGIIPTETEGIFGPFPVAEATESPSQAVVDAIYILAYASYGTAQAVEFANECGELAQDFKNIDLESLLKSNEYQELLEWNTAETMDKLRGQYVTQAELYAQVESLSQSYQRIQKLLAEGQRLIFERGQIRSRAAQRIQMQRYTDLGFRIFRSDALRRYQSAFDLAARYTYLAAKAYDYETGLLRSDTARTPGGKFLEDVVRARALGRFYVWLGTPMVGGAAGEPGLADILARMKADWDVVKGRFGFNNPETETSRFSLRTEMLRISPSSAGDSTWATKLESFKVANLHDVPEFLRYCRPYTDTTNVEPGLVIPFSSYVVAGLNYFGNGLAGGDNAYDASHAATKIRSAGVWFTGYNNANTNLAAVGLANEPRVYLIPAGEDIMRSPTRNAIATRHWRVLDQAIPLPYDVGGADIDNPDWSPVINSLREPLAQIRRFASLRAYHDSGDFDTSETCTNGRLVGRSVWNTRWLLIIPGRALLADPAEGIERFVSGSLVNGVRDGNGVKDIKIYFQTYSIPGD